MDKEKLIRELLDKKAEENNTIDLNVYACGLEAMYEALAALSILDVIQQRELFSKFIEKHYSHSSENYRQELKNSFAEYLKKGYTL